MNLWPLGARADEAHVAPHDIPELRELVEAHPAKESADPRHPRVAVLRPHGARARFGVNAHRAELVEREHPAAFANPALVIEHWSRRRHPHRDCHIAMTGSDTMKAVSDTAMSRIRLMASTRRVVGTLPRK